MTRLLVLALVACQVLPLQAHHDGHWWRSNAIYLGGDLALTAGHCAPPGAEVWVDYEKAEVVRAELDLSLLRIAPASVPAAVVCTDLTLAPNFLTHRYYDWGKHAVVSRVVPWNASTAYVGVGFRHGMSGSGLYAGETLLGVAETVPGFAWNTCAILGFLQGNPPLSYKMVLDVEGFGRIR